MKIVVELDRFNKVLSADNGYRPVPKIDTDESALIPDPAKDGGKSGRALWHSSESADLTLVYLVQTHENNSVRPVQLVVRATDGQVMRRILARKEF